MTGLQESVEAKDDEEEDDEQSLSDKIGSKNRDRIKFSSRKTRTKILLTVVLILVMVLTIVIPMTVILVKEERLEYPTYEEILEELEESVKRLSPHISIETEVIGLSVEKRNLTVLKMSARNVTTRGVCEQPLVWVVCGVHAREWTSPLTCQHFIQRLGDILTSPSHTASDILTLLQYRILVLANPDGYVYSMSAESRRLTRKNRQKSSCPDPSLAGVDINRNFGTGYNQGDDCYGEVCPYNATPCSITHGGMQPFSEPETRAVRDAMTAEVPWLSLSLHGNGNSWSSPFAYKTPDPASPSMQEWDLTFLAAMIARQFGTQYRHGSSAQVLYRAGGTMVDWVYEGLGVVRSYNHELRNICRETNASRPDYPLCIFQPEVQLARDLIIPEAWFGFKELLKHSYQQDCELTESIQ